MALRRRLVRSVPGLSSLVDTLDRTRQERDRLRDDRDRLRTRSDQLTEERDQLRHGLDVAEFTATERLGSPSFYASYERMKRVRKRAHRSGGVPHPVWAVNPKDAGRELAVSLGLTVPALLGGPAEPHALVPPSADRFVLKPTGGAAMRGVAVLERVGTDRYRSLFDRRTVTWAELVASAERAVAAGRISSSFLVEELVPGRDGRWLPSDWKCYCIGGRVELVAQKDLQDQRYPSRARFKFWDRGFIHLGPVRHPDRYDDQLAPPRHPVALVAAAERVAAALPSLFVRVDLYDGPDGPFFGEITPHPGGTQLFAPEIDRRLGEAWERAEAAELAAALAGEPAIS